MNTEQHVSSQFCSGVELFLWKRLLKPNLTSRVENQQKSTHDASARSPLQRKCTLGQGKNQSITGPVSFSVTMEGGNVRHYQFKS